MKLSVKKKIALATTYLAWILVVVASLWFARKIYLLFKYPSTNDAQVIAYINPVVSRVGGYLREIRYTDFQQVKKGDTLLVIDPREYLSDTRQISADIQKQQKNVEAIQAEIHTATQTANEARNAISGIEARVLKQKLEYDRYRELYARKSSTAQQLEKVKAEYEIAKSDLRQAKSHYAAALNRVRDIEARSKVIQAEKERLGEVENRRRIDLGYTVITAPYDGRLGKKTVEIGQMINAGEHLVYIVNDEIPHWVMANFKETQIRDLHLGDSVEIVADAFPDQIFMGKIEAFSPATGSMFSLLPPDNATGNFVKIVQRLPVKIALKSTPNQPILLQPGMNVTVTLAP